MSLDEEVNHAIESARTERDMQWWSKLCLVDAIAPTPEAVHEWIVEETKLSYNKKDKDLLKLRSSIKTYILSSSSSALETLLKQHPELGGGK